MIQLGEIVDALDLQSEEIRSYLNRQTGEVVSLSKEELSAAEEGDEVEDFPAWQQESIRIANDIWETDHYVKLPGQFEIHEWAIMRDFCDTVENTRLRDELLRNVHGKGAFRHFKDSLYRHGIEKQWLNFRKEALRQIALDWLANHDIPYEASFSCVAEPILGLPASIFRVTMFG